jgi:aspartyl-tRNA synthetase
VDEEVVLSGWLQNVRVMREGSCFGALRDHTGLVQLYAEGKVAEELREVPVESSLSLKGTVVKRPDQAVNRKMATGAVEVRVEEVTFVNKCTKELPFAVGQENVGEEIRLKNRFLDLRSMRMQYHLRMRAEVTHTIRSWMKHMGFVEVETPYLFRPTPEGAKEFLVSTRWPSMFYSLPQSPQQYKQLLMAGGTDRYFQIARCFRDEDMRKDRQPEFTQVDFEMAFADEADVMETAETIINAACRSLLGSSEPVKFKKMMYHDAMRRYGSDKPDLRIKSVIESVVLTTSKMHIFPQHFIKRLKLSVAMEPEQLERALQHHDQVVGLVDGKWVGGYAASLTEEQKAVLLPEKSSKKATLFAFGDEEMEVCSELGKLRILHDKVAKNAKHSWLWVTHFPMFERNADKTGWKAAHHPFTAPLPSDEVLIRQGGEAAFHARARAYDIVLNGVELGGGSVRIHDTSLQLAALSLIGVNKEKAYSTMGHLLDALSMGAPPHCGLAFGLDRLVMVLLDAASLKDIIAFPKAADGKELMVGSPAKID